MTLTTAGREGTTSPPDTGLPVIPVQRHRDAPIGVTTVAAMIGVKPAAVRLYLKRTRARINASLQVRPYDLPLPDAPVGRSPAWWPETIAAWIAERPGRGRTTPG